MRDYLTYLNTLLFNTEPDYKLIKGIFLAGLKEAGGSLGSILIFSSNKAPTKRGRAADSKRVINSSVDPLETEVVNTEVPTIKRTRRKQNVSPDKLTVSGCV